MNYETGTVTKNKLNSNRCLKKKKNRLGANLTKTVPKNLKGGIPV